jgi:hypothetical protein
MAQCISPLTIRNKKLTPSCPGQYLTVPCGKCGFCLQNRRKEWSFRLWEEFRTAISADFLTLTYREDAVPWSNDKMTLERLRFQRFVKAINKEQKKQGAAPMRYYGTGEYGTETDRPHYHLIAFNITPKTRLKLNDLWPEGFIYRRNVGVESIEYVTKYLIDADEEYIDREKPKAIMSKRPAIGIKYIERTGAWNYKSGMTSAECKYYTMFKGKRHRLPRIFKDRIFPTWLKELKKMEAIEEGNTKYLQEVERLKKFMENPEKYMEDCRIRDNEKIRIKSLKLNTL